MMKYQIGRVIAVVRDGRLPSGPRNVKLVTVVADDERGLLIDDGSGNPNGISRCAVYGDDPSTTE